MEDLGDLAELRLLAVLATYRTDGTALLSPVWHEWREGGFGVITSSRDVKAAHPEAGAAYAGTAGDDLLIRLEPGELRAWDFTDDYS
jgi:hypothetical protein